jgi:hypothetical protein
VALIALVLSLLIAAVGALGIASPSRLLGVVRSFQTPAGLYVVAALRVVLGVVLFFAAPVSRAPELIRILGVIVFVAGLVTPLFGLERFRSLLDWWSARGSAFIRAWAAFAFAFGLLLAYAVVP